VESADLRERVAESGGAAGALGIWMLESKVGEDGSLQRTPLQPLPFRIGRGTGLELVLQSNHVSKFHAEIYTDGLTLRVRDLSSRNGTFLNRERVTDGPLHDGDVLHVGDYEFRVARELPEEDCPGADGTILHTAPLSRHFVSGALKVRELIDQGAVVDRTAEFDVVLTAAKRVAGAGVDYSIRRHVDETTD
jgi:pSer/pThr/pTyr-binding forkhead associated (FHA) protein